MGLYCFCSSTDHSSFPCPHEEVEAETYINEEIAAKPYFYEEINAEPYRAIQPILRGNTNGYIYEEIISEPYVDKELEAKDEDVAEEAFTDEKGTSQAFLFPELRDYARQVYPIAEPYYDRLQATDNAELSGHSDDDVIQQDLGGTIHRVVPTDT